LWEETPPPKAQVVAVGAGAGRAPEVKVYDAGSGAPKFTILAYPANFRGGARVAVGDVNGDGVDDVVTGAGPGGGPVVKVFDGRTAAVVGQFTTFSANFGGGVTVAAADTNADGNADVIVGAGPGFAGGPAVWVVNGLSLGLMRVVLPYDPRF